MEIREFVYVDNTVVLEFNVHDVKPFQRFFPVTPVAK